MTEKSLVEKSSKVITKNAGRQAGKRKWKINKCFYFGEENEMTRNGRNPSPPRSIAITSGCLKNLKRVIHGNDFAVCSLQNAGKNHLADVK